MSAGFLALLGPLVACDQGKLPDGVRERTASTPSAAAAPQVPAAGPRSFLTRVTADSLKSDLRQSGRKATLVNAWASWCGPCRRELPMLQELAQKLRQSGVDIVLVSVDEPKDEGKAEAFLKENKINLQAYIVDGSVADFKQGINPRWPGMLPASFLFSARAELVHFWGGEAFEAEITKVTEAFLAGKPIEAETRYGLAPGKVEQ